MKYSARSPYDLVSVCGFRTCFKQSGFPVLLFLTLSLCLRLNFQRHEALWFQVFGPCFNDLYSSWNFLVFRGFGAFFNDLDSSWNLLNFRISGHFSMTMNLKGLL